MSSELEDLRISTEELEDIINLGAIASLAIDIYRALRFRDIKQIFSVLLIEIFTFILILILVLPISIIGFRAHGALPDSQILIFILSISGLCLIGWNIFLWRSARQNHSLVILLEKVKNYNQIIAAIVLLDRLDIETESEVHKSEIQEFIKVLKTTKESLINALKIAMIVNKYHGFINRSFELFLNLENNLTTLLEFDASQQTSQYKNLLNDALQIGMSVHREMKKLKKYISN